MGGPHDQDHSRWSLSPGLEPTEFAFDREHRLLFAACGDRPVVVMSTVDGHVVTTLPIGKGVGGVEVGLYGEMGFRALSFPGLLAQAESVLVRREPRREHQE